ncbi:MAG: 30S ribosomal protein S25 [Thermoproteota archaeon]|jgi:small subunit ribosomal protein S25e|uniref:30S ribosomal protein S25 n=1 Tax=Candidatus Methanodesulfokora washburnensis TaxID=2478471 RepID=A0A429GQE3_9CREN|nr:Rrf2 family transcriptional regulator [Candidatus Methanodesulfokores washburnensis]RSN75929.1 30S ribosomal protein S25 [Candidatus Methanodesulfokores washburnensis]RZN62477.1 MAG: 30S ribosomal protein S25 [Candidatus Methanodesulfokores washburnensis]TDA39319.1 MAG: 30S ribosomal protein S25 [Candidatus Korarchaeota archaeon]
MSEKQKEKIVRSVEVTQEMLNEMKKALKRAKVVTPQSIAESYGIKVSVAKRILRELEKEGVVIYVNGNSKLKIYKGVES